MVMTWPKIPNLFVDIVRVADSHQKSRSLGLDDD